MRIKFIVMMLLDILVVHSTDFLLSPFTFIRVEVDLGFRVNIVPCHFIVTVISIIGQLGLIQASDWANELGSASACPSLITLSWYCELLCVCLARRLSINSQCIYSGGAWKPHHSRYN